MASTDDENEDESLSKALLSRIGCRRRYDPPKVATADGGSSGTSPHYTMTCGGDQNQEDEWTAVAASLLRQFDANAQLHEEAEESRSVTPSLSCFSPTEKGGQGQDLDQGTLDLSDSQPQPVLPLVPPTRNLRTTSWWARLLKSHSSAMGVQEPVFLEDSCASVVPGAEPTYRVTIVSGCSGSFAEGEVLKDSQLSGIFVYFIRHGRG